MWSFALRRHLISASNGLHVALSQHLVTGEPLAVYSSGVCCPVLRSTCWTVDAASTSTCSCVSSTTVSSRTRNSFRWWRAATPSCSAPRRCAVYSASCRVTLTDRCSPPSTVTSVALATPRSSASASSNSTSQYSTGAFTSHAFHCTALLYGALGVYTVKTRSI